MGKIYSIMTHHKNPEEAAEEWVREGICAIGDFRGIATTDLNTIIEELKNLPKKTMWVKEVLRFWEIQKGDIIIANQGKGMVSALGVVVDDDYEFNQKNIIGSKNNFGYPHQKKVRWLQSPREFRSEHLKHLLGRLTQRGKTIIEIDGHNSEEFLHSLEGLNIPSHEGSYNEELVKAGLSKYVKRNIDHFETGMTIEREERNIDNENRPDFLARDKNGVNVIIECKGSLVNKHNIGQVIRYRNRYRKVSSQNARYFLVAFSFDRDATILGKKEDVEMFEVGLTFKKIS